MRWTVTALVFLMLSPPALAAEPDVLAPFAQPPAEYAGQFGEYRSPLLFADGRHVATVEQWRQRRREIRDSWMKELGPWPALIERPQIEILEQTRRDGLVWRRIRIEYAPGQMIIAHDLMSELGVSKAPVREGIHVLVGEGVMELLPNRSARIRRLSAADLRDFRRSRKPTWECRSLAAICSRPARHSGRGPHPPPSVERQRRHRTPGWRHPS